MIDIDWGPQFMVVAVRGLTPKAAKQMGTKSGKLSLRLWGTENVQLHVYVQGARQFISQQLKPYKC